MRLNEFLKRTIHKVSAKVRALVKAQAGKIFVQPHSVYEGITEGKNEGLINEEGFRFWTTNFDVTKAKEICKTLPDPKETGDVIDVNDWYGLCGSEWTNKNTGETTTDPDVVAIWREEEGFNISGKVAMIGINEKYARDLPVENLKIPLIMAKLDEESNMIIDGWHRIYRAKLAGVETLPCYVLTVEQTNQIKSSLI